MNYWVVGINVKWKKNLLSKQGMRECKPRCHLKVMGRRSHGPIEGTQGTTAQCLEHAVLSNLLYKTFLIIKASLLKYILRCIISVIDG